MDSELTGHANSLGCAGILTLISGMKNSCVLDAQGEMGSTEECYSQLKADYRSNYRY
jgi:hypothetical protein